MPIEADQFRRVVERHQNMVYSIALRITGDPGTAEEVAQDTFVALYRNTRPLSDETHLRFWLRKVVTRGSVDAVRRRKRQPEVQGEEWTEDMHGTVVDEGADALEDRVQDLLATLPPSQRAALVLRYGEDMRPDEIALVLGQPVLTVKSHLQRGLAMLRRKAAVTLKEYVRE